VPGMQDNLPAFEGAGLRYLAVGGVGLAGVWEDMRVTGRYLGRAERAEALVETTRARMASIAARTQQSARKLRVHWEWSAHPFVAARRSWITEMLDLLGAENVYTDLDVESVRVTPEEAIARQPDVVVACWCGMKTLPSLERILGRRGWQNTPAFAHRRVAAFKEDLFGRPGPRLAEGLAQLAALLAPEPPPAGLLPGARIATR
jgi:iron complex transport system substrate-binding protein